MLLAFACLIGMTFADRHDSIVTVESARATVGGGAGATVDVPTGRRRASIMSTPWDDAVEHVPEDSDGDDEEDPGEAMGPNGASQHSSALIAPPGFSGLSTAPPPFLPRFAPPPRSKPHSLSVLCRLQA